MSEYTVTYPIHLGQKVWVDSWKVFDPWDLEVPDRYLMGTIFRLEIRGTREKYMKYMSIDLDNEDIPQIDRLIKITIDEMGNSVFDVKPQS